MKIDLSKDELESLEELQPTKGFRVLQLTREKLRDQTLTLNSQAKNRDIIQKDLIIHETAIEQIRENNGFLGGVEWLIGLVEKSYRVRKKKEDAKGNGK